MNKLKDLKRARKQSLKALRGTQVKHDGVFKGHIEKAEKAFIKGESTYSYRLHPKEIKEHMLYWQTHPIWNKLIVSMLEHVHTKSNTTLVLYFNGKIK